MTVSDKDRDEEPNTGERDGHVPAEETGDTADAGPDEADTPQEDAPDTADQLDLGDEDTALPWLEGDDEDEEYAGSNSGQMIALLLLGLLAIGLVAAGVWWMARGSTDPELVADGSVIEAPDEPYKERPEDPGGKTFEGTGDTSFAVSEGETRPARLGEATPAPKPGFTATEKGSEGGDSGKAAASDASASSSAAVDSKAVGVQVGAFSTRDSAESGWGKLSAQYSVLSGLRHRIVEGQADIGTVYRLQALADNASEAKALCRRLRSAGLNCQVKN